MYNTANFCIGIIMSRNITIKHKGISKYVARSVQFLYLQQ